VVFNGEHGSSSIQLKGWRAVKKTSAWLPSTPLPAAASDLNQAQASRLFIGIGLMEINEGQVGRVQP